MNNILKNQKPWLLPAVLILFILEVFTFPFVVRFTYADRSENPSHVLTYTPGKLIWDNNTGVDKDGAAVLSLFNSQYKDAVISDNGDKIIAPGTGGFNIVRLKNSAGKPVSYTAVLYEIKDNPQLPVKAGLDGINFADTERYSLPESAAGAEVLRAVTGQIGGGEIQDFDIKWLWSYYEDDARDVIDTILGDKAAYEKADDVTVGLYIVIEDNSECITPDVPPTGDAGMGMYVALMCVSGVVLLLLIITRRREKQDERNKNSR